jgi:cysteinyl-tRNA synthetase
MIYFLKLMTSWDFVGLISVIFTPAALNMRLEAKRNKDWATSDKIRNELTALGFSIKDTKDGFEWSL